jgi:hypothetical protein
MSSRTHRSAATRHAAREHVEMSRSRMKPVEAWNLEGGIDADEARRLELIRTVRAQIARGMYDTLERLDAAADLLLASL